MDPLWSEICWTTFKYFIIFIVSTNYILCISWIIKCLNIIDARHKHEEFMRLFCTHFEHNNLDNFCIKDLVISSDNLRRKLSKLYRNLFSEFLGVSFRTAWQKTWIKTVQYVSKCCLKSPILNTGHQRNTVFLHQIHKYKMSTSTFPWVKRFQAHTMSKIYPQKTVLIIFSPCF